MNPVDTLGEINDEMSDPELMPGDNSIKEKKSVKTMGNDVGFKMTDSEHKEEEGVNGYDMWLNNLEMKKSDEQTAIGVWLNEIKMSQYFDTFINNGYDCMEFVRDIEGIEDLAHIGIKKIAHQKRIFRSIQQLCSGKYTLKETEEKDVHVKKEEDDVSNSKYKGYYMSDDSWSDSETEAKDAYQKRIFTSKGPDQNLSNQSEKKQIDIEEEKQVSDDSLQFLIDVNDALNLKLLNETMESNQQNVDKNDNPYIVENE